MKKSELRKLIKEELLKERIIKLADNSYEIKETKFEFLVRIRKRGLEGIVFLGAGGKLNDGVKGINDLGNKEKIGKGLIEDKMFGLYFLKTTGGRTDLVMIFKTKSQLELGKLAMWRLKFGDASGLSDYIVNYKTQHESIRKSELRKIIKEEIRKLNEASASIDFDSSQKSYKNITIKNETLKKGQMFTKCKLINCTNEGATCIDCIGDGERSGTGENGEGNGGTGKNGTGGDGTGKDGTGKDGEGHDGIGHKGIGEYGDWAEGTGKGGTGNAGNGYYGIGENGTGKDGEGHGGEGKKGTGNAGNGYDGIGYNGTGKDKKNKKPKK